MLGCRSGWSAWSDNRLVDPRRKDTERPTNQPGRTPKRVEDDTDLEIDNEELDGNVEEFDEDSDETPETDRTAPKGRTQKDKNYGTDQGIF